MGQAMGMARSSTEVRTEGAKPGTWGNNTGQRMESQGRRVRSVQRGEMVSGEVGAKETK